MKRKWKITLGLGLLLLIAGGVAGGVKYSQRGVVTVQTGSAMREDLTSLVTASGEIKPRNYINLGANAQGVITELLVKEGDHVRKNQVLARIENIQASADVQAQKATVASALADSAASEAGIKVQDDMIANAQATLDRNKAQLQLSSENLKRNQELLKDKLIAQQDFDSKKADYDTQVAAVREAQTHLDQMKSQRAQTLAQLTSAQRRVAQAQANLARLDDVLAKFDCIAPLDGVVTNLPVRVGETVVPGVQNSAASTIMTIADMSLITAEVRVDETDIVNVHLDQPATITIDAIPSGLFTGHVIEIGNTAILRSSGLAASESATSSQEAKDFKVVIALDNPPDVIRPGLSCTSKITTATRKNALTIPIQALTVRTKGDLEAANTTGAPPAPGPEQKASREEIQGVFIINGDHAEFRKVDTGITGATDIEVLSGLEPGDKIITGSYSIIRTLRNSARVKIDNKPVVVPDAKS